MGLLKVIEDAPGFLKSTFQGPQGSGKSRTATELACTVHKVFGSTKPIAFYDTETGSDYLADLIKQRTGMAPIRIKTRGFSDLLDATKECEDGAADVFIVDSITHVWRELNDAYKDRVNEGRKYPKARLDIQDIMQIKKLWEPWPDMFLNSPVHIIVCGREGNEWGNEENEETGKRELVTTGKKMKVEGEFGYEASLMVSMKAHQVEEMVIKKRGGGKERRARSIVNVATVLKDRFDVINGQVFEMPTGEEFMPHLELLKPSAHRKLDTATRSTGNLPPQGEDQWAREKRVRTIICEEIAGELTRAHPGQTKEEKQAKGELVKKAFGTYSWTQVEGLPADALRRGLETIKAALRPAPAEDAPKPSDFDELLDNPTPAPAEESYFDWHARMVDLVAGTGTEQQFADAMKKELVAAGLVGKPDESTPAWRSVVHGRIIKHRGPWSYLANQPVNA